MPNTNSTQRRFKISKDGVLSEGNWDSVEQAILLEASKNADNSCIGIDDESLETILQNAVNRLVAETHAARHQLEAIVERKRRKIQSLSPPTVSLLSLLSSLNSTTRPSDASSAITTSSCYSHVSRTSSISSISSQPLPSRSPSPFLISSLSDYSDDSLDVESIVTTHQAALLKKEESMPWFGLTPAPAIAKTASETRGTKLPLLQTGVSKLQFVESRRRVKLPRIPLPVSTTPSPTSPIGVAISIDNAEFCPAKANKDAASVNTVNTPKKSTAAASAPAVATTAGGDDIRTTTISVPIVKSCNRSPNFSRPRLSQPACKSTNANSTTSNSNDMHSPAMTDLVARNSTGSADSNISISSVSSISSSLKPESTSEPAQQHKPLGSHPVKGITPPASRTTSAAATAAKAATAASASATPTTRPPTATGSRLPTSSSMSQKVRPHVPRSSSVGSTGIPTSATAGKSRIGTPPSSLPTTSLSAPNSSGSSSMLRYRQLSNRPRRLHPPVALHNHNTTAPAVAVTTAAVTAVAAVTGIPKMGTAKTAEEAVENEDSVSPLPGTRSLANARARRGLGATGEAAKNEKTKIKTNDTTNVTADLSQPAKGSRMQPLLRSYASSPALMTKAIAPKLINIAPRVNTPSSTATQPQSSLPQQHTSLPQSSQGLSQQVSKPGVARSQLRPPTTFYHNPQHQAQYHQPQHFNNSNIHNTKNYHTGVRQPQIQLPIMRLTHQQPRPYDPSTVPLVQQRPHNHQRHTSTPSALLRPGMMTRQPLTHSRSHASLHSVVADSSAWGSPQPPVCTSTTAAGVSAVAATPTTISTFTTGAGGSFFGYCAMPPMPVTSSAQPAQVPLIAQISPTGGYALRNTRSMSNMGTGGMGMLPGSPLRMATGMGTMPIYGGHVRHTSVSSLNLGGDLR